MINGIISVIVIFLIFSIGFWFTYRKYWPDNTTSVLSVIVVKIGAPALAIISISDRFTQELLKTSLFYISILLIFTFLLYITGKLLSRVLHLEKGRRTVFEVNFTFSNTIFIGLPINEIVFGHDGLPYLFTFYLITITSFWSLGAYELSKASPLHLEGYSLKKIFNPGFIGVIIGFIIVGFDWSIPSIPDIVLRYLSGLCVPLSLLVIGANLSVFANGLPKIKKDEFVILIGKFMISPIYMYILLSIFNVEGLAFQVFMLTSTMPCHMQTSILADYYKVDSEYASKLVSLSTLVCLITIPIYVAILK